ncbi:GATA transcription factor 8-like [Salvia hispanica]|uniref:GATA transcription factor 8-like n=1 Tax=Salvia hispanica TaxID=49212 RepID=UPI0020094D11|nr:GATA transcription factor 8-like [Salvia hispanica]
MEPELIDEIDCGNFFGQMEDLIEFPPDIECDDANVVSSSDYKDFPTWDEALQGCDSLFSVTSASDLAAELSVPYEDIVQLEWLSTFMEDSFSGSSSSTSSPTSGGNVMPLSPVHLGPQRARSKRPRPPAFNPKPAIQLVSPSSSCVENPRAASSPESDSFAESLPSKKSKKIKITLPANPTAQDAQPVRKCLHCEVTKTPQWRAGPMGPKTLCNACGVRHKTGRLFPEYRPAASPTFVPSLHSNSHKKVVEMRCRSEPRNAPDTSL